MEDERKKISCNFWEVGCGAEIKYNRGQEVITCKKCGRSYKLATKSIFYYRERVEVDYIVEEVCQCGRGLTSTVVENEAELIYECWGCHRRTRFIKFSKDLILPPSYEESEAKKLVGEAASVRITL